MLSTRKPGPPVPPRPSAAAVAHALQKHGDKSPTSHGRTVVYKSPTYDQKKPPNTELTYKNFADQKKPNNVIILEDKTNGQSTKKYTSTCNLNSSSSASTSASSSPSSTLSKGDKKKNVVFISNGTTNTTKTTSDNLEIENNLRNLVKQKLFTEIIINSNKTNSPATTIVEAKNKNVNVIRSSSVKLPYRPEPEGGERTIDDKICEKKSAFHEMLISELTAMRNDGGKRQRHVSDRRSTEVSPNGTTRSKIRTSDWIEVGDNGKEVLLSSCQISLEDSGLEDELEKLDDASSGVGDSWDSVKDTEERVKMSLPGLPPLPKSLSGFDLSGSQLQLQQQQQQQIHQHLLQQQQQMQQSNSTASSMSSLDSRRGPSPVNRKPETLDTQLAVLRREMYGLRQLDLSLLSQLWALNESIQEFRSILQEQETLSPPSPSPSNSDANSVSSDDDGDDDDESSHHIEKTISANSRMRTAPPPPPPNRKAPSRPV